MSTIVKALIRDCDAQADTAIVVTPGCTILKSSLPQNWTVEFLLDHPGKMIFRVDGQGNDVANQFWNPPYCPDGHNVPLNLPVGPHTISATIVGQPAVLYPFTIALPVVNALGRGVNLRAVTDAASDPTVHPQLVPIAGDYVRMWTENQTGKMIDPFPAGYFAIPQKWAAVGKKVMVVIQYVNQAMPLQGDFNAKIGSVEDVWGVCLGNEIGGGGYPKFSIAQVLSIAQWAYPILSKKGIKVIAPSLISSLGVLQDWVNAGLAQFIDYWDYHCYEAKSVDTLNDVDAAYKIVAPTGKPLVISEWGTRGTAADIAGWAVQQQANGIGFKTKPVLSMQFPAYPLDGIAIGTAIPPGSKIDPLANYPAILGTAYQPNGPFYAAWQASQ